MGNVDTKMTFRKAIVQLGTKNQVNSNSKTPNKRKQTNFPVKTSVEIEATTTTVHRLYHFTPSTTKGYRFFSLVKFELAVCETCRSNWNSGTFLIGLDFKKKIQ